MCRTSSSCEIGKSKIYEFKPRADFLSRSLTFVFAIITLASIIYLGWRGIHVTYGQVNHPAAFCFHLGLTGLMVIPPCALLWGIAQHFILKPRNPPPLQADQQQATSSS